MKPQASERRLWNKDLRKQPKCPPPSIIRPKTTRCDRFTNYAPKPARNRDLERLQASRRWLQRQEAATRPRLRLSLLKSLQGWKRLVIFADQPSICREILMKCRESRPAP
jgi:hypothetical protein